MAKSQTEAFANCIRNAGVPLRGSLRLDQATKVEGHDPAAKRFYLDRTGRYVVKGA